MTGAIVEHGALDFDASLVVTMLSPEDGGRQSATPGREWRCRLRIDGRPFEAELVSDSSNFTPGDKTVARVRFLDWPSAAHVVRPGVAIEVWELRRVAVGCVKSVARDVRSSIG